MRCLPLTTSAAIVITAMLAGCSGDESTTVDATATPKIVVNSNNVAELTADKVYLNGKIITVNDAQPKAQAVAIKDGSIIYVGDLRGVKPLIGDTTEKIDLLNRTLVPGFVDAHGHVVNAGLQAASANILPMPDGNVNSFDQLTDTLNDWASSATGENFIANTG